MDRGKTQLTYIESTYPVNKKQIGTIYSDCSTNGKKNINPWRENDLQVVAFVLYNRSFF